MLVLSRLLDAGPVTDPEEDAFVVFSQDIPSQSLGFIDSQAAAIELTVAGCDLLIHQSRGLLTSDRTGGTTGAVVWRVTPLFAEWIASPTNFLFANACLSSSSTVLELGAGISGIVALTLGARVARYTATDQAYVLKILKQNIAENLDAVLPKKHRAGKKRAQSTPASESPSTILTQTLDWETDDVSNLDDVDLVVACDCIYNESLIEPLNTTCAAICRLRQQDQTDTKPTICLIAQQLRSPDVFEAWLKSFHRLFTVWQVPDHFLSPGLSEGSGFVVHIGIVR